MRKLLTAIVVFVIGSRKTKSPPGPPPLAPGSLRPSKAFACPLGCRNNKTRFACSGHARGCCARVCVCVVVSTRKEKIWHSGFAADLRDMDAEQVRECSHSLLALFSPLAFFVPLRVFLYLAVRAQRNSPISNMQGSPASDFRRRALRDEMMIEEEEDADIDDDVAEHKTSRGTKRKHNEESERNNDEQMDDGPPRKRALASSQPKRVSSQAVRTVLHTMTQQRLLLHCNNITLQAARNILDGQAIHPLLCYNQLKTSVAGYIATITCSFAPSTADRIEGDFLYYAPEDLPASSMVSSSLSSSGGYGDTGILFPFHF